MLYAQSLFWEKIFFKGISPPLFLRNPDLAGASRQCDVQHAIFRCYGFAGQGAGVGSGGSVADGKKSFVFVIVHGYDHGSVILGAAERILTVCQQKFLITAVVSCRALPSFEISSTRFCASAFSSKSESVRCGRRESSDPFSFRPSIPNSEP